MVWLKQMLIFNIPWRIASHGYQKRFVSFLCSVLYLVRSLLHLNVGSLWYIINTFYCGCDAYHAYRNPLHPAEVSTISQIILHVKGL